MTNYPDDFILDIPCVRCGACCKAVPCMYGKWNETKTQCEYLEVENTDGKITTYRCGDYDNISKSPDAWFTPAFGAGCCRSLFNEDRDRIVRNNLLLDKSGRKS